jgi:hypothetical protein
VNIRIEPAHLGPADELGEVKEVGDFLIGDLCCRAASSTQAVVLRALVVADVALGQLDRGLCQRSTRRLPGRSIGGCRACFRTGMS